MDDYNNSPYVPRPGAQDDRRQAYREYNNSANSMARAASTLGVVAVISVLTFLIYPSIVLGSVAIILAILSRDRNGYMHEKAKTAVTTGALAIGVNLAILGVTMSLLYGGGAFKQQVNDMFKEVYGYSFDEMWDDAKDGRLDLNYGNLPFINENGSGLSPTDL